MLGIIVAIAGLLAMTAIIIHIFGLFHKQREAVWSKIEPTYLKVNIWWRLRRYRRHIKGVNWKQITPDPDDPEASFNIPGKHKALFLMRDMVENETPVDVVQIIEAQLYETARVCPRSKQAMMFTLELVRSMINDY